MKRILVLFVYLLLCLQLSCVKRVEPNDVHSVIPKSFVTIDDVHYYIRASHMTDVKSVEPPVISPIEINGEIVMYLVNYSDGWEVLSGDKRVSQVLIMSEKGHAKVEDLYRNPSQALYVDQMSQSIYEIKKNNQDYDTPLADDCWPQLFGEDLTHMTRGWSEWFWVGEYLWQTMLVNQQDHLLSTKWGQMNPWNEYTPTIGNSNSHCYTGCSVVAWAQVLYYLHYYWNESFNTYGLASTTANLPSGSNSYVVMDSLNTQFSNYGNYWNQMPLKAYSSPGNSSYVAALMTWLGYLSGAQYSISGTNASLTSLWLALTSIFGFSANSITPCDFSYVKNDILNNHVPCILSIINQSTQVGHAVVLDGFKVLRDVYHAVYVRYNEQGMHEQREEVSRVLYRNFVAINWGNYGNLDSEDDGSTIWYNTNSSWYDYSIFYQLIYGLSE